MWDWLTDGIVSFIIDIYNHILANTGGFTALAQQSPSEFNPELWDTVTKFNQTAVLPVAYLVFGCFIMADFIKVLTKQNPNGLEAMHMVLIVIVKMVIGEAILTNIPDIIDSIFGIAAEMLKNNTLIASNITLDSSTLSDALEQEGILSLLAIFFQALVIGGVDEICNVLINLVVQLRYIEIYVFTAIAALPLAVITSSNHEVSVIGYGYLKRMCALAIQVVFIMVCFMMYTAIVNNGSFTITDNNVVMDLWSMIGNSILLVIALFQTGTWSKALFQVH